MNKLTLLLTLLWSATIMANSEVAPPRQQMNFSTLKPDAVVAQSAGYLGALYLGAEYAVTEYYAIDFGYGYTPKALAGIDIQQYSLRNSIRFSLIENKLFHLGTHLGLGLTYGNNNRLFIKQPEKYPIGYYQPSALRYILSWGLHTQVAGVEVFSGLAFLDTELSPYYNQNWEPADEIQIGSFSIGCRIPL